MHCYCFVVQLLKTLQMSITDAYLAFNLGVAPDVEAPTFSDFLSRLAYQLIHNEFDAASFQSPVNSRRSQSAKSSPAVALKSHEQHALYSLCLLSPYNGTHALNIFCTTALFVHATCRKRSQPSQTMQRERVHEENITLLP